MIKTIKIDNFLYTCLIFSITAFIAHFIFFRHTFPEINIDEASFFSPAYSLVTKGQLSTDLHSSFLPGASDYTYWMPPAHMFVLGMIFKVTGPSVFIAKLISFIYVLLAAFAVYFWSDNKATKVSALSLLFICPFVILCSTFIRMEAMGFLIVSVIILAIKKEAKPLYLGVLAAIAIMIHPLLVAAAAGASFYSLRRGLKELLLFSIAFLITVSPYLYYIFLDFNYYQDQMSLQLFRKASRSLSTIGISYILQSVPLAIGTLYLLFKIKKHIELRYFITIGVLISLLLILKSGEFNYHLYLVPYALIAIALYLDENQSSYKYLVPAVFYGFFCLTLASKLYESKVKPDNSFKELIALLNQEVTKGKRVYVYGSPDVSIFLLEKGKKVERQNAVATIKEEGWDQKYDYVVQVVDHLHPKPVDNNFCWLKWKNIKRQNTADGHFTLITYSSN